MSAPDTAWFRAVVLSTGTSIAVTCLAAATPNWVVFAAALANSVFGACWIGVHINKMVENLT